MTQTFLRGNTWVTADELRRMNAGETLEEATEVVNDEVTGEAITDVETSDEETSDVETSDEETSDEETSLEEATEVVGSKAKKAPKAKK